MPFELIYTCFVALLGLISSLESILLSSTFFQLSLNSLLAFYYLNLTYLMFSLIFNMIEEISLETTCALLLFTNVTLNYLTSSITPFHFSNFFLLIFFYFSLY